MMLNIRTCLIGLVASALLSATAIGQIDTFEDGTTMGWFVPELSHPSPPVNIPTGGPTGADDAYLQLTATGGSDAGSRLAVLNASQWTGDYLTAGINVIRMDVHNFGPADLYLRLLFEDFEGAGPPANLALSADAIFVPATSGWMTVLFPIAPADLLAETFGTVAGALTDTDTLRIFHNPDPAFPGPGIGIPPVAVVLGVDNITALAVPEPGTLSLLAVGLLGLLLRRRQLVRRISAD